MVAIDTTTSLLLQAQYQVNSGVNIGKALLSPTPQSTSTLGILQGTSEINAFASSDEGISFLSDIVSIFSPENEQLLQDLQAVSALSSFISSGINSTGTFTNPYQKTLLLSDNLESSTQSLTTALLV